MLSQQDFSMIESMMERVVGKNNEEMKEYVKETINESEKFLLDEIERYYNFSKMDILKLSAKVDDIAGYYRIKKFWQCS